MDKLKFCEELKKKGYDAFVDGGVVMVKKAGKIEDSIKEIKELAGKFDYNESLGVRAISSATTVEPEKTKEVEAENVKSKEIEIDLTAGGFEQMSLF